jgi:hypothetical protein
MAPAAPSCSARTGSPAWFWPTTIAPRRRRRSARSRARATIAMTSLASLISKKDSRGTPLSGPPRPTTSLRRLPSLTGLTRGQVTRTGSRRSSLPWRRWASSIAASRLWAAPIAWPSPVMPRLMRVGGDDLGPPAAGAAALAAEHRAERGLAQAHDAGLADLVEAHAEADRGDRLALAERGRGDRRDDDERPPCSPGPAAAVSIFAKSWPYGWKARSLGSRPRSRARAAMGRGDIAEIYATVRASAATESAERGRLSAERGRLSAERGWVAAGDQREPGIGAQAGGGDDLRAGQRGHAGGERGRGGAGGVSSPALAQQGLDRCAGEAELGRGGPCPHLHADGREREVDELAAVEAIVAWREGQVVGSAEVARGRGRTTDLRAASERPRWRITVTCPPRPRPVQSAHAVRLTGCTASRTYTCRPARSTRPTWA